MAGCDRMKTEGSAERSYETSKLYTASFASFASRASPSLTRALPHPRPLPLKSLNHVSIHCRDVNKSLRFYRDLMGFIPVKRPTCLDYFDGAWLFNYGLGIHLLKLDETEMAQPEDDSMPHAINPRSDHVSFQCDDISLVEAVLKEHDIPFVRQMVHENGILVHQLFFHDPDFHMIEICNCDALPVVPLLQQEQQQTQATCTLEQGGANNVPIPRRSSGGLGGCRRCKANAYAPLLDPVKVAGGISLCVAAEGRSLGLARAEGGVSQPHGWEGEAERVRVSHSSGSMGSSNSMLSWSESSSSSLDSAHNSLDRAHNSSRLRGSDEGSDEFKSGDTNERVVYLGTALGEPGSLEHLKRRVEQLKGVGWGGPCPSAVTALGSAGAEVVCSSGKGEAVSLHVATICPSQRVSCPELAHAVLSDLGSMTLQRSLHCASQSTKEGVSGAMPSAKS